MDVASMTTATAAMPMGMEMNMKSDQCKISMLWNWYTIDSCFIARSWHIKSSGMFAGSCIGVILLVMSLELLRHAGREYDRYLLRKATRYYNSQTKSSECSIVQAGVSEPRNSLPCLAAELGTHNPRVTLLDQIVRAGLRMLQFGVAYFIMLLAMSYNGYIISCITIGAFLGPFVFDWESRSMDEPKTDVTTFCG